MNVKEKNNIAMLRLLWAPLDSKTIFFILLFSKFWKRD